MASWMIHLRIADELLMRLPRIDETAFVMGNIVPDSGVPNSDWTEYHPPKAITHFYKKTDSGRTIDVDSFCKRYFDPPLISAYSLKEYSFFLGYYLHLLTDVRWTETILSGLKTDYPNAYAENKHKLIEAAKEDWYDLDFLYLEKHPDFRAFAVYDLLREPVPQYGTIGYINLYILFLFSSLSCLLQLNLRTLIRLKCYLPSFVYD